METEQPLVRISVRNLVEFILRSGDIDNRAGGADKDAMLLGGKIHRKIQRRMGADYHAEVAMKMEIPCRGFILSVEGRADGVIETLSGIVIDEIKGIYKDLELFKRTGSGTSCPGQVLRLYLCQPAEPGRDWRTDDLLQYGYRGHQKIPERPSDGKLKGMVSGDCRAVRKMGQIPDRVERKEKCFDPGGAFSLCLPGRAEKS